MIHYLNNMITLILLLDFLQRQFPKQADKMTKLGSNIYIICYSYFEVQMKKNGIDVFCEPPIEKVSIVNEYDKEDENYEDESDIIKYNREIWDLVNKHRTLEKEKYS